MSWSTLSKKEGSILPVSIIPSRLAKNAGLNAKMRECKARMQG
jgi:hypothetical protein